MLELDYRTPSWCPLQNLSLACWWREVPFPFEVIEVFSVDFGVRTDGKTAILFS
jgi:hypothetical protein